MEIALIAHDTKKELMTQFCIAYCGILSKHNICATATTGKYVADATGLNITRLLAGEQGGEQQIASRISYNEIDVLLYFRSTAPDFGHSEVEYNLMRLCDVHNVPVDYVTDGGATNQNWGNEIVLVSSVHLDAASVASNSVQFVLTDSNGKNFVASGAELSAEDALTIRLTFTDFNNAAGECTLSYTPGTLFTMAGTVADQIVATFTPENLVPKEMGPPKILEVYNV